MTTSQDWSKRTFKYVRVINTSHAAIWNSVENQILLSAYPNRLVWLQTKEQIGNDWKRIRTLCCQESTYPGREKDRHHSHGMYFSSNTENLRCKWLWPQTPQGHCLAETVSNTYKGNCKSEVAELDQRQYSWGRKPGESFLPPKCSKIVNCAKRCKKTRNGAYEIKLKTY